MKNNNKTIFFNRAKFQICGIDEHIMPWLIFLDFTSLTLWQLAARVKMESKLTASSVDIILPSNKEIGHS